MTDLDDKFFDLLLTEKDLADKQIESASDLNLKVLSFFGAAVVILGWNYSGKNDTLHPLAPPVICLALVAISCGVILQGISTYGIVLGYIQYKNEILNQQFQDLLEIPELPIKAVRRWRVGAARFPVLMATASLLLLHLGVCMVLLMVAAQFPQLTRFVVLTSAVLAVTFVCEVALTGAILRVFWFSR